MLEMQINLDFISGQCKASGWQAWERDTVISYRVGSKRLFWSNTSVWLEKWDETRYGELSEDGKCGFPKKVGALLNVGPNTY